MSATIIPFCHGRMFDPEMTHILGEAYDMARKRLHRMNLSPIVQETIAKRIIEIGESGEHDPARICDWALSTFGLGPVTAAQFVK